MIEKIEVRPGAYHDSVSLMQVSRAVANTPGVAAAQVAMATELNIEVLTGMGFSVPAEAGPNDLLVALRADDEESLARGLEAVATALDGLRRGQGTGDTMGAAPEPRTLGSAVRRSEASLVVISVPGPHAVTETHDAIAAGASVMLFSDNVSVDDEIALKDAAAAADVLVMGPDCGTAVVSGVALGFANIVRRGEVGMVAASGTGAQQILCLLDTAGVGVSHCLGVGGRDLTAAVAGRSTRQALAALAADGATERVIVVSKPPDAQVLAEIEGHAADLGVDVHWATLGAGRPDLTASTEAFLAGLGRPVPTWPAVVASEGDPSTRGTALRGLYCGGTLAQETKDILVAHEVGIGAPSGAGGHVVIDFGDDDYTRGRAHPMIDPSLRMERIALESKDPTCGVLLLDLVLGHGAHPDPAGDLAAAISAAKASAGRDLPVVVALVGTDADPQGRAATERQLSEAGASVFLSNAAAAAHAISLLGRTS